MGKMCFLFAGLGAQWPALGLKLMDGFAAFRDSFRSFDSVFTAFSGWSVEKALSEASVDIFSARLYHPAIVATQWALWNTLKDQLPKADLIIGHSGGEVAAALAAGALTLDDAARLTFGHVTLMDRSPEGRLLHLALPQAQVEEICQGHGLVLAAYNSPKSFVVSGPPEVLKELAQSPALKKAARLVPSDRPFHSPVLIDFVGEFEKSLIELQPQKTDVLFISTLTGGPVDGDKLTGSYWSRHVVEPVLFNQAVVEALQRGANVFLDFSPHPALLPAVSEIAASAQKSITALSLMDRDFALSNQRAILVWEQAFKSLGWPRPQLLTELANEPELSPLAGDGLNSPAQNLSQPALEKMIVDLAKTLIVGTKSEDSKGISPPDDQVAASALPAADAFRPEGSENLEPADSDPFDGIDDPATTPFMSLGLSSLALVKLVSEISRKTGYGLSASLAFSHPDARSLAGYLAALGTGAAKAARPKTRAADFNEPIAVVGAAARFPGGANNLNDYWDLLAQGVDAVGLIPASRWDWASFYHPDREHPGTMYTRESAFIDDTFRSFDAGFFSLAGREAKSLDPQQRLLLEMSWEAFEQGAINPWNWKDRKVGVFLGLTNSEYSRAHRDSFRRELIDAYSLTGTTSSGACGRLSYFFGFNGPCFTVDTACSSSLVALSRACQSLALGESDMALVGSVTLMLIPDMHICFTKLGAISPDGRSKTFDDQADGYGRGEGGAVVLLRRLKDAEADGDLILGLIRSQALNQDGRSNGLTAPSGLAQRQLIEEALSEAALSADDIDYVEAHGTGTALGDSVELEALAEVFGPERSNPLVIGSVKANIGHLEPAAALASLLKILLSMRHGQIPPNIHLKTPNHHFNWASGILQAPTALLPWPARKNQPGPKRAGLSAFGFSGVNGHAIIEEYIPTSQTAPVQSGGSARVWAAEPAAAREPGKPIFLTLSAQSPGALAELARTMADKLSQANFEEAASLAYSLATCRPHMPYRLAAVASQPSQLAALLNRPAAKAPASPPALGLLFTGQGSQYPGMGLELAALYPAFQKSLDDSAQRLIPFGLDLMALLDPQRSPNELTPTSISQPLICAVSLALWELWRSLGLHFELVCGHSLGEFPAAAAAGLLTSPMALELTAHRGRLMDLPPVRAGNQGAQGHGGMLAAAVGLNEISKLLAHYPHLVLAADNAPTAVTVSGPQDELAKLAAELDSLGLPSVALKVSQAFHSSQMAPAASQMMKLVSSYDLGAVVPGADRPGLISTWSGRRLDSLEPAYFRDQILSPVLFRPAVETMAQKVTLALEAGPSGTLAGLSAQCGLKAIATLKPGQRALETFLKAAAALYLAGVNLDFKALFAPLDGQRTSLPPYPFQRQPYWMELSHQPIVTLNSPGQILSASHLSAASAAPQEFSGHPVLGRRLNSPALGSAAVFESLFNASQPAFLWEHVLFTQAVSPAAGHLSMILSAVEALTGKVECRLLDVTFSQPLVVAKGQTRLVQVIIDQPGRPSSPVRLISRLVDSDAWQVHASGTVEFAPPPDAAQISMADPAWPPLEGERPANSQSGEDFYNLFVARGYNIGPSFRRLSDIVTGRGATRAWVETLEQPESGSFVIPPGTLDSVLQSIMPSMLASSEPLMAKIQGLFVPFHLQSLCLWGKVPKKLLCLSYGILKNDASIYILGSVTAYDEEGRPCLALNDLTLRLTSQETFSEVNPTELFYQEVWQPLPATIPPKEAGSREIKVIWLGRPNPGPVPEMLSGDVVLAAPPKAPQSAELIAAQEADLWLEALSFVKLALASSLPVRLHLVTWSNRRVKPGQQVRYFGSTLLGLGRTLMLEHPGLLAGMVDLVWEEKFQNDQSLTSAIEFSLATHSDLVTSLNRTMAQGPDKSDRPYQLALRGDQFFRPVVEALHLPPTPVGHQVSSRQDGLALITGANGSLAGHLARHLVSCGVRRLALVSRPGPGEAAAKLAEELKKSSAEVLELKADITRPDSLGEALNQARSFGPITSVWHLAGTLSDSTLMDIDREKLVRVFEAKVAGALNLHLATLNDPVNDFVVFSSAAGLLGSTGQANYVSANLFVEALTEHRRSQNLPAAAPGWGPWAEGGMADTARREQNLRRQGFIPLSPQAALTALDKALAAECGLFCVMGIDWAVFGRDLERQRDLRFSGLLNLPALEIQPGGQEAQPQAIDHLLAEGLKEMTATGRRSLFQEALTSLVADLLGFEPARLEPDKPLAEYGFDSLMVVTLRNRLNRVLKRSIPVTLAFEYPTIEALTGWVADLVNDPDQSDSQDQTAPAAAPHSSPKVFPNPAQTFSSALKPGRMEPEKSLTAKDGRSPISHLADDPSSILDDIDRLLGEA
jgi:acyl transferase domain-containing protein/NAD(P)-dependent dehydrogenase (short-subunit alcohol dehydrogenase family)/acyl carrier protein